ncbi:MULTISPECIES: PHP domain-containing protein [unclassified Fusibacter]|uniref:PHP domain-containing protein n=1 Tax=unclassified Fusibacter TaxID=2624464 RepID=UPI0013E95419|nr:MULTISPECIES: PHP domain-containing protein [unclassified Fusibacter]MCK8058456.1 PHP domain-containing protein [Fusibacter sp. A2]NPE22776.1 PHP domain-containing protein [Fusibacter sp. A1]
MHFIVDLHVHTTASGDAYSTLMDYVNYAKEFNINGFGITEHGPDNPVGPHEFYFANMNTIPRFIDNVLVLKGVDANITDYEGTLDIKEELLDDLDYAIASFHELVLSSGTVEENTQAILGALKKSKVRILGDLGNPRYPVDYNQIVDACLGANVAIEVNDRRLLKEESTSSVESYKDFIQYAYEKGVTIILSSDSHFHESLAEFNKCFQLLDSLGIPRDYPINYRRDVFFDWLNIDLG